VLYLASQSPRRRQLLEQIGLAPRILALDLPEERGSGESALDYVSRVARDKALAGLAQVGDDPSALVLGADTEVVLDDDVFGKPADAAMAAGMLRRLSGRCHEVISVAWAVGRGRQERVVCRSQVRFAALDEAVIQAYIASGECFGKAGGYAIQGRGATLIAHLDGSFSGVMGLPLFEVASLLRAFGITAG